MVALKTTPEKLKSTAGNLSSEVSTVKTCFQSIDRIVNSTNRYWQGDASKGHMEKYSKMKPDIDSLMTELAKLPNVLLEIAGLYVEVELANVETAATLPMDIF